MGASLIVLGSRAPGGTGAAASQLGLSISPLLVQDMIGDANPMVVANAVAALSEIQEISGKPVFQINASSLSKLLRALNECTEWGQVRQGGAYAAVGRKGR